MYYGWYINELHAIGKNSVSKLLLGKISPMHIVVSGLTYITYKKTPLFARIGIFSNRVQSVKIKPANNWYQLVHSFTVYLNECMILSAYTLGVGPKPGAPLIDKSWWNAYATWLSPGGWPENMYDPTAAALSESVQQMIEKPDFWMMSGWLPYSKKEYLQASGFFVHKHTKGN